MMDIDKILDDLQTQIQALEDAKSMLTELQEDNRQLISTVDMWFAAHGHKLPEVDKNG